MTKKEKAVKEININELKANFRTIAVLIFITGVVLGLVGGYFASISIITDSQAKAIEVVSSLKQ